MLGNEATASTKTQMLPAASRGAGAANGAYLDVSQFEGDLCFVFNTGAVTGSVAYKVQDADDTGGTNVADVAGATLAGVQNADGAIVIRKSAIRKAVRVVATVTGGPVLC